MMAGGLSRRTVLAGGLVSGAAVGAAVALAGCQLGDQDDKKPDPLEPVLTGTLALKATYDATVARYAQLSTRLVHLRADHDAHIAALNAALGRTGSGKPSRSASPSVPAAPVPDTVDAAMSALATAEKQAQQSVTAACLTAPDRHATLLGSIAACRATHVAVLT